MDGNRIYDLFYNIPGGASIRNLLQWIQIHELKRQTYFDFGEKENIKVYGQPVPPVYEIEKFKDFNIKTFLTISDNDGLIYPADNYQFVNLVQNKDIITIKVILFL